MSNVGTARRVRASMGSYAVQTSLAALALAIATPAAAECVTDASGNVACADTAPNGTTLPKDSAKLTVAKGALVSAGQSRAGIVNTGRYTQMAINGAVAGDSRPGVLIESGSTLLYGPCDPYAGASVPVGSPTCTPGTLVPYYKPSSSTITVGAGASITGSTSILLTSRNGATASASVDNAGTLTAANGPALVAGSGTYFESIQNRATGFIGGISGALSGITNAGTIDGGSNSAIANPNSDSSVSLNNSGQVLSTSNSATVTGSYVFGTNSGTISNAGTGAAIVSAGSFNFSNSGTISNAGTGAAIISAGSVNVSNAATGTIASAGPIAIQSGSVINLTNEGMIRGSVIGGTGPYASNFSTIDTRKGTITGDVRLGAGNDTVMARYDAAAGRITSIGGTIDAGGGSNLLQLDVDGSATFGRGTLPGSFDRFGFGVTNGATVTLGSDVTGVKAITASGNGTFVNAANLTATNASAISTTYSTYQDRLDVVNSGTIVANTASPYLAAVSVNYGSLTNSGTIRSTGVGVNVSATNGGTLTNSGTIVGTTGGANVSYADLVNSGSISASNGTGVSLFRGSYTGTGSTNSGTIAGSTIGATLYGVALTNSGTIIGGTTGLYIDQSSVDNLATGIISGGTNAIDGGSGYNTVVRNAGTINGNVNYTSTYNSSPHVFIDNGGTVSGAIRFGNGNNTLVVNLTNAAGRPLAGATGGVQTGTGFDTIRYVAASDATAAIAVANGFDAAAYEVANGATLKLTSPTALAYTLGLTGTGKIDVTADIAVDGVTSVVAIDLTSRTSSELARGVTSTAAYNPDLMVVSHGALTIGMPQTPYSSSACGVNAGLAGFENAGSITVTNNPQAYYASISGICGGKNITNSGTISLAGGIGIVNAVTVTNTGSITDIAGSRGSGILGATTIINKGQITVDQVAVGYGFDAMSLTNTGRIESRSDTAVELGFGGALVNATGATIKGKDIAVFGTNASVSNSGTIIGDVVLNSYVPAPQTGSSDIVAAAATPAPVKGSRYEAAGGTVTGNLIFGNGNDQFIQTTASTGISGYIDGGAGTDTYTLAGTGSGTFTGATNFERLDVASGSWTLGTPALFRDGTGIASGATLTGTSGTLLGAIDVAGTLRINQDFDGDFLATLSGNGALVKAGTGSVSIKPQTSFTGNVSIVGGRLIFTGNSRAQVTVANATFAGTGSVGRLAVGAGGIVSPGDGAIGTLAVQGDFTQAAGSTYLATLGANGTSDLIAVTGAATLAPGANLAVGGTTGAIGTRYTLVRATGGVQGRYALTQQAGGLTEVDLAYSATNVFADVVRSRIGLAALAGTANQRGVAVGLAGLTSANATYATIVRNPDDAATRASFDMLSGEVHATIRTAMVQDARIVEGAVLTRALTVEPGSGLWGTMIGNRGTDDGDRNAAQASRSTFGGVGGVDLGLDDARIGVAGGYTRTKMGIASRASSARVESYHVMGYGGGQIGPISIRAGIGYAWTDNRTDRTVAIPGAGQTLRASYDGNVFHSFSELGYVLPIANASVQPLIGFDSYRVHGDRFDEKGGSAALSVAARSESFAFAKAGLRFQTPIVEGLSARATTAWVRRVDGTAPSIRASFAGSTSMFDVTGAPLSRDGLASGLDLTWSPAPGFRIVSSYSGAIGGQGDDSSFRLSASIGF